MRCIDYEKLFSQYVENDIAREDYESLRFHLKGCYRCRIKLEDMQQTVRAMTKMPDVNLRPEFDSHLHQCIHTEITRDIYAKPSLLSYLYNTIGWAGRPSAVRAGFAMGMLIVLVISLINNQETQSPASLEYAQDQLALDGLPLPLPVEPAPAPMMLNTLPVRRAFSSISSPVRVEITTDGIRQIEFSEQMANVGINNEYITANLTPTRTSRMPNSTITLTSSNLLPDRRGPASIPSLLQQQADAQLSRILSSPNMTDIQPSIMSGRQINRRYILPAIPTKQAARVIF